MPASCSTCWLPGPGPTTMHSRRRPGLTHSSPDCRTPSRRSRGVVSRVVPRGWTGVSWLKQRSYQGQCARAAGDRGSGWAQGGGGSWSQGQNSALGGEAGSAGSPIWSLDCRVEAAGGGPGAQRALRRLGEGGFNPSTESSWARPPFLQRCVLRERHLGYLDGEPAKAVLKYRVSGLCGRRCMLWVFSLSSSSWLLTKDLPENTLVRVPENTSQEAGFKEPEEENKPCRGLVVSGERAWYLRYCVPPGSEG